MWRMCYEEDFNLTKALGIVLRDAGFSDQHCCQWQCILAHLNFECSVSPLVCPVPCSQYRRQLALHLLLWAGRMYVFIVVVLWVVGYSEHGSSLDSSLFAGNADGVGERRKLEMLASCTVLKVRRAYSKLGFTILTWRKVVQDISRRDDPLHTLETLVLTISVG